MYVDVFIRLVSFVWKIVSMDTKILKLKLKIEIFFSLDSS